MQIIINVAISTAIYLLIGLSFSIIYFTVRFFHIAHGAIYTLGAYVVFSLLNFLLGAAPNTLSKTAPIGIYIFANLYCSTDLWIYWYTH